MTSNVRHEVITYEGWDNCHRLSNDSVDLIVSGGFGPRVLRFGYAGGDNTFSEQYAQARGLSDNEFKLYGGHRLWHAPEDPKRTYVPDNSPIEVSYSGGVLSVIMAAEPVAQIEKAIDIALDPTGPRAIVTHTLTNRSVWDVDTAAWALSVMPPGGTAVLPLPARAPHGPDSLLPTHHFVFWSYTDLSDRRWSFAPRALLLHGDPTNQVAQKIGVPVSEGWLAYWRGGITFIKRFDHQFGVVYPDEGSSAELFTNGQFLELETLGPVVKLRPGESVEHIETWELTRDLPAPDVSNVDQYLTVLNSSD